MRAIWSGMISFGLVSIPIKLYSAVQPKELSFHMLHKEDLSPIRFARVCKKDGREIAYEHIVKGYEIDNGDYVVMDDKDFEKANIRETNSIEIVQFTDGNLIDLVYCEKPYYLEPEKKAQKPYALLIEALRASGKVGIARFVLRSKEHLGLIRPEGNVLLLEQMRFHEEIRQPDDLKVPSKNEVAKKEMALALQLIDQLSAPFKPETFKDTYTDALKKIIETKAAGKTPKAAGTAPEPIRVRDLMEILKKSLEKEQKAKPAARKIAVKTKKKQKTR